MKQIEKAMQKECQTDVDCIGKPREAKTWKEKDWDKERER